MASPAICLADRVARAATEVSIHDCTLAWPCSWYSRACSRQSSLSASRAQRASSVSPASYSLTAAEIIPATAGGSGPYLVLGHYFVAGCGDVTLGQVRDVGSSGFLAVVPQREERGALRISTFHNGDHRGGNTGTERMVSDRFRRRDASQRPAGPLVPLEQPDLVEETGGVP